LADVQKRRQVLNFPTLSVNRPAHSDTLVTTSPRLDKIVFSGMEEFVPPARVATRGVSR